MFASRLNALAIVISGGKLLPHFTVDESLLSYFELWATVSSTCELQCVVLSNTGSGFQSKTGLTQTPRCHGIFGGLGGHCVKVYLGIRYEERV